MTVDDQMLNEAQRFNARLARAPRFGMRHRFMPHLIQSLLRLSQLGARLGVRPDGRLSGSSALAAATLQRLRAWPATLVLDGPRMLDLLRRLTPGLDDATRREAPLSPLHGELAGMAPALMMVGERDPLDDTARMAQRWAQVAAVELNVAPEAPHGFIHCPTSMATQAWVRDCVASAQDPVSASA